jgi:hypothetical protein
LKHKHHVIPKHMGGSDEPENIVELSIEEHAEEHRKLYELHGHWQDLVAWKGLLGLLTSDECTFIAITKGARKGAAIVNARRAIPGKDPKLPYHKWLSGYSQDVDGRKVRTKRFWFNDGVSEGQFSLEDFPEGWKRGRLKSSTSKSFKNVSL